MWMDVDQKLLNNSRNAPIALSIIAPASAQNHHTYGIIVIDVIINIITNIISSSRTEALNNSRNVPIALSVIALPPSRCYGSTR